MIWFLIDYETINEAGLVGIELLKDDDQIIVFHNPSQKKNIEEGVLKQAINKNIEVQFVELMN